MSQKVFITDVPSLRTVQRWIKEVNDGARTGLGDAAQPSRPRSSITGEIKSKVPKFIENDPYLSGRDVAHKLDSDHSTILRILREDLDLRCEMLANGQCSAPHCSSSQGLFAKEGYYHNLAESLQSRSESL